MKRINSISCDRRPFATMLRNFALGLHHWTQPLAALVEALVGELRRLNALGSEIDKIRPRGERAALARKALAERYREHSRCC